MIDECKNCKYSQIHEFSKDFKVISWYCPVFKKVVPAILHTINCSEYEPYESNLHDNNAARSSPQTRDNGIHQEE